MGGLNRVNHGPEEKDIFGILRHQVLWAFIVILPGSRASFTTPHSHGRSTTAPSWKECLNFNVKDGFFGLAKFLVVLSNSAAMSHDRESLQLLLMRSVELEGDLMDLLRFDDLGISPRWSTSRVICAIAFEHAESAKMLANAGNFTSFVGLLRLQYEALVRALWLYYAAPESAVEKLAAELTHEAAQRSSNLPMAVEMLEQLKQSQAPPAAVAPLLEFREYSWKALNSFIHGGLHAIRRHDRGYPVELLLNLIRQSNGLSLMVGQLLVILHGGGKLTGRIPQLHLKFMDCLPEPKGPTL